MLHTLCGGTGCFPRAVGGRWAATAHHAAVGVGARKIRRAKVYYRTSIDEIQPHIQLIDYPTVTYKPGDFKVVVRKEGSF